MLLGATTMKNTTLRRFHLTRALLVATLPLVCLPVLAQSPQGDAMTVGVQLVAEGLTSPVYLVEPPDGSGRLFVVDQVGLIRVIEADGTLLPTPFLDWRAKLVTLRTNFDERGLLGLAFHPEYATNGRFFIYYSAPLRDGAPAGFDCTSTVSELSVSDDPDLADADSEAILLQVDKPQFNHNAGTLAFGPDDGYLYVSIGDGGGANDVGLGHVEDWYADNGGGNGQDVQANLLGNLLRIDVDGAAPYGIPPDNPFAAGAGCADGCDEIYAYGFRNPYRFSFDPGGNHALLVGDAGQGLWEEVSLVTRGGNYGWNVKEGTHCFDAENNRVSPATCPSSVGEPHPDAGAALVDPVIEYGHASNPLGGLGIVVIGGHVYRGDDVAQLRGRYVFGDLSRGFAPPDGTLFAADPSKSGLWRIRELAVADRPGGRLGHYVFGFGQDAAGEVYVLTTDSLAPSGTTGRVYRITRAGNARN
jgi:glucose/arabinose dehydrogenase